VRPAHGGGRAWNPPAGSDVYICETHDHLDDERGGIDMHRKLFILGLLVSLITSIVSACSGTPAAEPAIAPAEEANEEPATGLANPASVYCQEQGGTVEIRTDAEGGQYGVCIFDDGSECDEWAYFRGECQPGDFEVAPPPVPVPAYVNERYGFSCDPPSQYAIEGYDNHTIFRRGTGDYALTVGYKWVDEDVEPLRSGLPAGELQDAGTVQLMGQEIAKALLVYEGKIKAVSYGPTVQVGNLELSLWLDAGLSEGAAYEDIDVPPEAQAEAEQIIASFALLSGETPEVKSSGE
jgi:putative hemolysin